MDELDWARINLLLVYGGTTSRRRIARLIARRNLAGDLDVLWATVASDEPRPIRERCLEVLAQIAAMDEGRAAARVLVALTTVVAVSPDAAADEVETDLILN